MSSRAWILGRRPYVAPPGSFSFLTSAGRTRLASFYGFALTYFVPRRCSTGRRLNTSGKGHKNLGRKKDEEGFHSDHQCVSRQKLLLCTAIFPSWHRNHTGHGLIGFLRFALLNAKFSPFNLFFFLTQDTNGNKTALAVLLCCYCVIIMLLRRWLHHNWSRSKIQSLSSLRPSQEQKWDQPPGRLHELLSSHLNVKLLGVCIIIFFFNLQSSTQEKMFGRTHFLLYLVATN